MPWATDGEPDYARYFSTLHPPWPTERTIWTPCWLDALPRAPLLLTGSPALRGDSRLTRYKEA